MTETFCSPTEPEIMVWAEVVVAPQPTWLTCLLYIVNTRMQTRQWSVLKKCKCRELTGGLNQQRRANPIADWSPGKGVRPYATVNSFVWFWLLFCALCMCLHLQHQWHCLENNEIFCILVGGKTYCCMETRPLKSEFISVSRDPWPVFTLYSISNNCQPRTSKFILSIKMLLK